MTTTTNLSINSFVSEEEQRFLQALPFLVSFGLTLYMPIAARKSLSVWRALQVYDSQEPPKKGFTGEKKRERWEKIMGLFWCLSPSILLLIASIPIKNEANWPIYSTIRRYAPFSLLAMILIFASFSLLGPLLMPIKRVGRELEAIPDKKTKQKKAANVSITRNYTKEPNSMANIVVLFSIFMSGFVAYHFEKSSDSILIVMVMAIASTIMIRPTLVIPMAFKTNTSLRSHVKFFVLIFIGSFALGLAFFAIGFCGAYLYLTYLSFTKNSSNSSSKPQATKTSDEVNMVMSQMVCLTYTAIWPMFMAYPAFLMNLAYRFDVSTAGHTQVTDEQKEEAIKESREVAKHCKPSKHPNHHYDNVGRTPILLDAISLRLPEDIKSCDLPTFSAAMKTMIATQVASLLITLDFLPSEFNIPYFVRSQKGAEVFPFPVTTNFGVLLAFIFIVPVMLFSAGFQAKKNGQSFGSGVRAIWTYEEKWGADYFQTKIDHQMDLMDTPEEFEDEKEEKLLADITNKEEVDGRVDLIA